MILPCNTLWYKRRAGGRDGARGGKSIILFRDMKVGRVLGVFGKKLPQSKTPHRLRRGVLRERIAEEEFPLYYINSVNSADIFQRFGDIWV